MVSTRHNLITKGATAAVGLILASAVAASPALASVEAATTTPTVVSESTDSELAQVDSSLRAGKLEMRLPDELKVEQSGTAAYLVGTNGERAPLVNTITSQGISYSGQWAIKDAHTAVFSVSSTSAAQQGQSTISARGAVTAKGGGYAHCIAKTALGAAVLAGITGLATGPGDLAIVPIALVGGFVAGHITCMPSPK